MPNHKDSSNKLLKYLSPIQVKLDLPFIHTTGNKLLVGCSYLYIEGRHTMPVRLLEVSDANNEVQLRLQKLDNNEVFDIGWNLLYAGDYVIWEIYDLTTIFNSNQKEGYNLLN